MKIRHKLMIFMLAIAILPAVLTSVLHRRYMLKTGDELAGQTRQMLIHNATHHLRTVVTDFGRLADQYKTVIELALARRAREVEARLTAKPPAQPRLFFSHDYDAETHAPTDLRTTEKYRRVVDDEERRVSVSFGKQVFFLVKGIPAEHVARDMACLSTMPTVYRELYKMNPSGCTSPWRRGSTVPIRGTGGIRTSTTPASTSGTPPPKRAGTSHGRFCPKSRRAGLPSQHRYR